jgi:hypothetical protein
MTAPHPTEVQAALDRMNGGEASADVLATIVSAAEAYASMPAEWGFDSPHQGMFFTSRNDMLIETMHQADISRRVLRRYAPDWDVIWDGTTRPGAGS